MSELMRASRQWSSRPADERFWSVADMFREANAAKQASDEAVCELRQIMAHPVGNDIAIAGPAGIPYKPTNWGFSQLCRSVSAPADFLTNLPAELACDCLNYRLKGQTDKVKVLLQRGASDVSLRAVTSEGYKRFWDSELCQMLKPAVDQGWKVPPARSNGNGNETRPATAADLIPGMTGGAQVKEGDMIAPSGVYRGDRDSFVFVVNPTREIDSGNGGGGLFKGIIASNSEVGKASIRFQGFCHEGVCGNHIIWGVSQVVEMKRKHYGDLSRFLGQLRSWLHTWTNAEMGDTTAMIVAAKRFVLGADQKTVVERIKKLGIAALTLKALNASYDYAEKWEHTAGAAPVTAWGFVHGLTRYSQTLGFADQRNALDVAGGKILNLAV